MTGIPYEQALAAWRKSSPAVARHSAASERPAQMQSPAATGGQDHGLGANEVIAAKIKREDDGASAMAVLIAQEFDYGAAMDTAQIEQIIGVKAP